MLNTAFSAAELIQCLIYCQQRASASLATREISRVMRRRQPPIVSCATVHRPQVPAQNHHPVTCPPSVPCPASGAVSATSSLSGDGHSRSITPELATEDDPEVNASPNVKLFPMFRPKSQRKVRATGFWTGLLHLRSHSHVLLFSRSAYLSMINLHPDRRCAPCNRAHTTAALRVAAPTSNAR